MNASTCWQDSVVVPNLCLPVGSSLPWAEPELPFSSPRSYVFFECSLKIAQQDCLIVNTYAGI